MLAHTTHSHFLPDSSVVFGCWSPLACISWFKLAHYVTQRVGLLISGDKADACSGLQATGRVGRGIFRGSAGGPEFPLRGNPPCHHQLRLGRVARRSLLRPVGEAVDACRHTSSTRPVESRSSWRTTKFSRQRSSAARSLGSSPQRQAAKMTCRVMTWYVHLPEVALSQPLRDSNHRSQAINTITRTHDVALED